MSSRVLGIDIRNHFVNGVVVRTGFKTERIEAHFQVPLAGQGEFETKLSDAINKIVARIDVKDIFCQVALPSDWIIYRNINIPIKGQRKIRQVLPYELEPLLAQPVELFTFDFLPVAINETGNGNHMVAAGVERIRLKACLDALTAAKIDPDIVTAGSYAMASCLPKVADIPDQAVLVTMDEGISSIYLLISGQIGMVRVFRFPSGKDSDAAIIDTNLHQTISAFEEQYNFEFDPQTVYLNQDAVSRHTGVESELIEKYDYPVKSIDISAAAGLPIQSTRSTWHSGQMNNALALVLVRTKGIKVLDFRRGDYGKRIFFSEQRANLIKTAVLCGLVLVLAILAAILDGYYTRKTLRHLDEQVATVFTTTFPEVRRIVDPLQQMKVKIREEKNRIAQMGDAERKVAVIDILNDISRLIPKKMDVTLTGVTIGPENMLLSGHAENFDMVNDMRADLERAEWVDTSIISSANQDKTGQRIDFKIKLVFKRNVETQGV
jgi:type II secretion system protein L